MASKEMQSPSKSPDDLTLLTPRKSVASSSPQESSSSPTKNPDVKPITKPITKPTTTMKTMKSDDFAPPSPSKQKAMEIRRDLFLQRYGIEDWPTLVARTRGPSPYTDEGDGGDWEEAYEEYYQCSGFSDNEKNN